MPFEYVTVEDAIRADGLRMVVVGDVPSPWGEAAKGILHIKNIDWKAVRLAYDDKALAKWAGELSGPVAVYNNEPPRSSWEDILMLAEELASSPSLLPETPEDRATMLDMAHELLGKDGLAWSRRLQMIHQGLNGNGGFRKPVAKYLAQKYGYTPKAGEQAEIRVGELLELFSSRLKNQSDAGSPYYIGNSVTALDIYSAACMALFKPLPPEQCSMHPKSREAFSSESAITKAHLDDILLSHRGIMYQEHLELPLNL